MDFWWHLPRTWQAWLLLPCTWLYRTLLLCRSMVYRCGLWSTYVAPVPVIVVGNMTVGGTGKTPLVIALVKYLQQQGLRVGVVSRGYGAKPPYYPHAVMPNADAKQVGDEPLLIARETACPVMIDPKRPRAIQALLKQTPCNIIVSDDGLQHLAMHPSVAVVVSDGKRGHGNGLVLPAGPLREPLPRDRSRYLWVVNGSSHDADAWSMTLSCGEVYHLRTRERRSLADFAGQSVLAIAGIGYPHRFFEMLKAQGLHVTPHAFPDHYAYQSADFQSFDRQLPWFMTEKDAVKCQDIANACDTWVVPVHAVLPSGFWRQLEQRLQAPHQRVGQ